MTLFVSWVLHLNMRKIYYHFVYCFRRILCEIYNYRTKNSLIDFWAIIGIILLKVAIPLDVVSIYKSCGRMRDGKHSCLFTYLTTERKVVVG